MSKTATLTSKMMATNRTTTKSASALLCDMSDASTLISIPLGGMGASTDAASVSSRDSLDRRRRRQKIDNIQMLGMLEKMGENDSFVVEDTLNSLEYSTTTQGSFIQGIIDSTPRYYYYSSFFRPLTSFVRSLWKKRKHFWGKHKQWIIISCLFLLVLGRLTLGGGAGINQQQQRKANSALMDTDAMTLKVYRQSMEHAKINNNNNNVHIGEQASPPGSIQQQQQQATVPGIIPIPTPMGATLSNPLLFQVSTTTLPQQAVATSALPQANNNINVPLPNSMETIQQQQSQLQQLQQQNQLLKTQLAKQQQQKEQQNQQEQPTVAMAIKPPAAAAALQASSAMLLPQLAATAPPLPLLQQAQVPISSSTVRMLSQQQTPDKQSSADTPHSSVSPPPVTATTGTIRGHVAVVVPGMAASKAANNTTRTR